MTLTGSYSYSFSTTDPEGDGIEYTIDWGDGITTTIGFYASGVLASAAHTWDTPGTYSVKVMAIDYLGVMFPGPTSEWSDSLAISITEPPPSQPPGSSGSSSGHRWCGCLGIEPFVLLVMLHLLKRRKPF